MSSVYRNRPDGKTVRRKKSKIGGPFTPLLNETMVSPAWRALSHGAVRLYIELKRRYSIDDHNNGRIYFSQREGRAGLKTGFDSIANWFRELEHYGFIVQTSPGCLGVDGMGKSPHWRLTELGYMREPPTKDFLRWNGVKFRKQPPKKRRMPPWKKTESRTRGQVHPAPAVRCTTAPAVGAPKGRSAPDGRSIQQTSPAPTVGAFLEEPSHPSELEGTASGGLASALPQSAVASEPTDNKQSSSIATGNEADRARATAEIAQLVGWEPLVELSPSKLNELADRWANRSITAATLALELATVTPKHAASTGQ